MEFLETNVCIIGSGPAAHTAAIYCARAELKPILFEGWMANDIAPGGQLTTTNEVENYPGFPDGIGGTELMNLFRKQSEKFNTKIITETVTSVNLSSTPFIILNENVSVKAKTVILATGAVARKLDFPGSGMGDENGYWNRGISACAVCDGAAPMFRDKPLAVVGGGDSAMEEALFLTKYASKVFIIHRRNELRASKILQNRALSHPKIEFILNHTISRAIGDDKKFLSKLILKSTKTNLLKDINVSGLFYAIGHTPATSLVKGQIDLDDDGYIKTIPGSTCTNIPGVFAAGDVQDKKFRQAITAAGSGCMAALEVEHYLNNEI